MLYFRVNLPSAAKAAIHFAASFGTVKTVPLQSGAFSSPERRAPSKTGVFSSP
jgi:hypothetical protein